MISLPSGNANARLLVLEDMFCLSLEIAYLSDVFCIDSSFQFYVPLFI